MFRISIKTTFFILAGILVLVMVEANPEPPELNVISKAKLRNTGEKCGGRRAIAGQLFTIELNGEVLMRVCHNSNFHATLGTEQILNGNDLPKLTKNLEEQGASNTNATSRIYYRDPLEMYPKNMIQLYSVLEQPTTLVRILGRPRREIVQRIFLNNFLAHGHLTPKMNFQNEAEKAATNFLINTVPQWQSINNGNWKNLETSVYTYARISRSRLVIETGAFGILCFLDKNNLLQPLYLNVPRKKRMGAAPVPTLPVPTLPVPRIIYKKITDTKLAKTVVIIVENNPFLEIPQPICRDVCSGVTWLRKVGIQDMRKGYTYCCDEGDFLRAINVEHELTQCS